MEGSNYINENPSTDIKKYGTFIEKILGYINKLEELNRLVFQEFIEQILRLI